MSAGEEMNAKPPAPDAPAGGPAETPAVLSDAEKLKAEVEKLRHEYLLQRADFENLRRRLERQKQDEVKFAAFGMVKELMAVIDSLEMALSHAPSDDPMRQGVAMVLDVMMKTLGRFGVERVSALGKPFDPTVHEAMGAGCDPAQPDNTVIGEQRTGYLLHGRLVRPAGVVINRLPHPPEGPAAGPTPPG